MSTPLAAPPRYELGKFGWAFSESALQIALGDDPACRHLHRHFHLGLVARLPGTRRNDGRVVLSRHLRIGAVDRRLVEARLGDARPQIVGDDLRRDPVKERESPHVRADPVNKALRKAGFRIGVVGCAERGDEQLADAHLSGRAVPHFQRLAGVVHEQSARRQHAVAAWSATGALPRRGRVRSTGYSRIRRDGRRDVPPTTAAASRAPPAQLAMDRRPVRLWSLVRRRRLRWRVQTQFQRRIAEVLRQRPDQAGPPCPPHAIARRRHPDRQAGRDLAFGDAAGTKPQHVAYLAHG